MAVFELILCIIAAVVVSSFVSRFVPKVSTPLVQIVLGVLVTYLPFFPDATLDPELFMVLFIAPLLYLEAHEIDKSALLKTLDLSLSLAIGLAIVTMAAVGFTLHAVWPSITLASALALGAALGPTDAVAVSSLGKEASLTQRQRSVLKGESLFNDASGIVGFQFAIAAAITGETTSASAYRGAIVGYLRRENSVISRCFVANADSVVGGQANGVSYSGAVETKFIAASDVNSQTHIDELNAYEKPKSLLKITFRAPTAEETWAGGNYIPGEAETAKGYEAKLLGFAIDGHQAEIDEAAKTVTLVLPHGTTLTSLTPTLTRSSGATYTPAGAQDFSGPVTYTVTSGGRSSSALMTVVVE